jgi:hypothetical protein
MNTIDLGAAYVGHFPQFEADYITKRSGLGGFVSTVWRDNAVVAVAATVTEQGTTGEYAVTFMPTAAGLWTLEVYSPTTGDRITDAVRVAQPALTWGLTLADGGTTSTFSVWLERDGVRQADITSVAAVLRAPDGTEVADLGTDSADTGDGLFTFTCASALLTAGASYYLACTATRAPAVWYNNLGFAKA